MTMKIQTALQSKAPGTRGEYSFVKVLPALVVLLNIAFIGAVIVAMAFDRTTWEKWDEPITFTTLSMVPALIPLLFQILMQQIKKET